MVHVGCSNGEIGKIDIRTCVISHTDIETYNSVVSRTFYKEIGRTKVGI